MAYTKQNWHTKWTDAKKKANLKDSLFKKRLGPDFDDLEATHALLVKADAKAFPKLWKKHGTLSVKIAATIKAYRPIVQANVINPNRKADVEKLLADMDTKGLVPMAAERNARHHALGLDSDD